MTTLSKEGKFRSIPRGNEKVLQRRDEYGNSVTFGLMPVILIDQNSLFLPLYVRPVGFLS
jgi:hypothetical protein